MSNSSSNEQCSLIFDHARSLYAAHRVYIQLAGSTAGTVMQSLKSLMEESARQIVQLGGKVETGTDVLGMKGPLITNADGTIVPYDIGRMEAEKILSSLL